MSDGVVELDLRPLRAQLRRRWLLIVGVTVLIVGAALVWAWAQPATYEARARVLVATDAGASLFRVNAPVVDPNRVVQTELLVFESAELRAEVRRRLGGSGTLGSVAVRQVEQTDVIEIIASSRSGRHSAAVANAYASAYIERRRAETVDNVVAAAEQLQARISDLQRQIDGSAGDRQSSLIEQQGLLRQKLDQLQVDGALQDGVARLISEASAPRQAIAPDRLRIGIVALVFGFLVGVGVALAVEYLDGAIRTVEDVGRAVPDLGVLGVIPVAVEWKGRDDALVVSLDAPHSPAAEAVRMLRTSLAFLSVEHELRVVQVTSADEAEGKSATAANLGVAFARVGRPVVIVDCDLRRPRLHRFFNVAGAGAGVGLTSVITGQAQLADALVDVAAVPGLSVLPAGPSVAEPSELIASKHLTDVVAALAKRGALVILDCPPVLPVADALAVARLADATVVVCRSGAADGRRLARCVELLRQVKAPLAGIVLNAATGEAAYNASDRYYRRTAESLETPV